jgi:hypothetical protein
MSLLLEGFLLSVQGACGVEGNIRRNMKTHV